MRTKRAVEQVVEQKMVDLKRLEGRLATQVEKLRNNEWGATMAGVYELQGKVSVLAAEIDQLLWVLER